MAGNRESGIGNRPVRVRVALCAGEASGDLLGAGLVARLLERFPDAQFAGIGGPKMRAEGFEAWHDCSELAVMGLAEVLAHLPRLLRLRRSFRKRVLDWKPDVFIGIDAPDFNLGVERWLKARGVRTVHYVSPSVWAWRAGRAAKIGRSADRVLCLFPMEPPIYARHGVDARFVGHPLADAMALEPDRNGARATLGLTPQSPVLAVLPGSRRGEIERLLPVFLDALPRIAAAVPGLIAVLPAANAACRAQIEAQLAGRGNLPPVALTDGRAGEAMIASDVVLLASGTATLEALLAKRPMVVAYRIAPLTYALVKGLGLLKTNRYSLPNALAGEAVVPELMQADCTAEKIAAAVIDWFKHPERLAALAPRFEQIHAELRRDASGSAAAAVAELLDD
ncbi:MAG TPA: lipid-A-disaccharide synthase [Chiayiivirga sp.]|nr:lipid-A-disaccharide synthase [Chiayiivirga sp.]